MFFQKNISEDLELDRSFRVNKSTCYIIFNFFISTFIFYLFIYFYYHRSCALTICLSYHYTYLNIVFNLLEKSYTHSLICKTKREKEKKAKRAKWKSIQRCVLQICYRVSICWLHHKSTSINVIDNENQNIDEDSDEKVKINSTLCFSNLSLFEHSINWLHDKTTSINVVNSLITQ